VLTAEGWGVVHVRSLGLQTATEKVVLQCARDGARILVSADTDFGALLAASHEPGPSLVLVRRVVGRRVDELAGLLIANLPQVEEDLRLGCIVVIGDDVPASPAPAHSLMPATEGAR
jgi:predicted nuclease of predicted toxin-antitoxin system